MLRAAAQSAEGPALCSPLGCRHRALQNEWAFIHDPLLNIIIIIDISRDPSKPGFAASPGEGHANSSPNKICFPFIWGL